MWDDYKLAAAEMGWRRASVSIQPGPRVPSPAESLWPPSPEVPTHPESDAARTWSTHSWGSSEGALPRPAGSEPSLGLCVDMKLHPLTVQILAKQGPFL